MKRQIALFTLLLSLLLLISAAGCDSTAPREISQASINENGELVLVYSDGSEENLGTVVGEQGANASNEENTQSGTTVTLKSDENAVVLASAKGLCSSVSISCKFTQTSQGSMGGRFPSLGGTAQEFSSSGSGVIYKLDKTTGEAFIITNYHVVYNVNSDTENGISDSISVFLYGAQASAQAIPATYVGGSLYYDIAVLHIADSELLKSSDACAATLGDSDTVRVGETAIAIGNPESMGISVSSGIVSVDSEYITMTAADESTSVSFRVMRIDTAVNSGNSGGGLFNNKGELIGIVNAKITASDVENIGYAIPSNVARSIADNIIDYCYGTDLEAVQRGLIGITVTTESSYADYDESTGGISVKESVIVYEISAGGLADGVMQAGDKLISIGIGDKTVEITRQYHIIDFMLDVRAGDVITVTVERNGEAKTLYITMTADHIVAH